jgi:hypothetical protein
MEIVEVTQDKKASIKIKNSNNTADIPAEIIKQLSIKYFELSVN